MELPLAQQQQPPQQHQLRALASASVAASKKRVPPTARLPPTQREPALSMPAEMSSMPPPQQQPQPDWQPDWQHSQQQHQPAAEARIDQSDGNAYTEEDFIAAYGGTAEWDAALPAFQAGANDMNAFVANGHGHGHGHGHGDGTQYSNLEEQQPVSAAAGRTRSKSAQKDYLDPALLFWKMRALVRDSRTGWRSCLRSHSNSSPLSHPRFAGGEPHTGGAARDAEPV